MRVPHSGQNAQVLIRPLSHFTSNGFSAPERSLNALLATARLIPNALPDWRWHPVQWHTARPNGDPSTRYLTRPHWHPPSITRSMRVPPACCEFRVRARRGAHNARDLFVAQLRIEYYFERRWSEPVIVLSSATVRCAPSSWSRNFAATSVS